MIVLLFAMLGLLVGSLAAGAPAYGFLLTAGVLFLAFTKAPAYMWASGSVLAAVISRVIVTGTGVPEVFNFVHFPLALAAACLAFGSKESRSPLTRWIEIGLGAFLLLCLLSTAVNGGELLRPFLTWLVFCEPFLVLYAILRTLSSEKARKLLWFLFLACVFLQVPLAVMQAIALGTGDPTQGSFTGMGAGSHIAGGVGLLGLIACIARAMGSSSLKSGTMWAVAGAALLSVPILSDAKQAIVAFILAVSALTFGLMRRSLSLSLALLLLLGGVISASLFLSSAFDYYLEDYPILQEGARGKIEALSIITEQHETPAGLLVGLGSGNSVSRVGLMANPFYGREDSPVAVLGLKGAPTTDAIMEAWSSHQLWSRSSIWSGISSWNGLFGDLGILGLLIFFAICWKIWTHTVNLPTHHKFAARTTPGPWTPCRQVLSQSSVPRPKL